MSHNYDVVILGGGSGGYACALRATQLGKSVALVERDKLGGTCLHNGCVPTKALLHAAELADGAREGSAYGIRSSFDGVDMAGVNAYKDRVVSRLHKGLQGLVNSAGVTYVEGEGRLVAPTTAEVNGTRYTGADLVLATGSYPRTLPGIEIGGGVITSDEALCLAEVPEPVVIIGGSEIGVEFASVWRSFGAEVTIIEALPSLVPLEDPSLGKHLERAFSQARDRVPHRNTRRERQAARYRGTGQSPGWRLHSRQHGPGGRRARPVLRRPGLRGASHHARPRMGHYRREAPH